MKELYEFLNPSDTITFYAENDDIARAVTLILGNGKAGCRKENGEQVDNCFTAFGNPAPQKVYDEIEKWLKEGNESLIQSFNSLGCCNRDERPIFDEYIQNDEANKKFLKWDETHRSSMNDFCGYARRLAKQIAKS